MDPKIFSVVANGFAEAVVLVCKSMGVDIASIRRLLSLPKWAFREEGQPHWSGFVTSKVRGTVAIMVDEASFNEIVSAMSGGAITPKLGDPLSMSVLGDLADMASRQAFIKLNEMGSVDLTPPQLLVGEHIRSIPSAGDSTICFTLPFRLKDGGTLHMVLAIS